MKPTFDLAQIDTRAASEKGHEIQLEINGQPTGWFVTVLGDNSQAVKSWQIDIGNNFRKREWQEKRKGKNDSPSLMTEEDLKIGLRGAAVRIGGFRGVVFGGKPFEYSADNAYELVRRYPPFADQILEASADIANFTKTQ